MRADVENLTLSMALFAERDIRVDSIGKPLPDTLPGGDLGLPHVRFWAWEMRP